MLANFGYGALLIAFLVSIYGIIASIYGMRRELPSWVESARLAMLLTFPLITVAALSLVILLVNGNYEIEYVSSVTSSSMPLYLRITSLWGGQAGSLLFWGWLMSGFATAVTLRKWHRDREFLPWVIVVSLTTLAFFLGLNLFTSENPFQSIWRDTSGQFIVAMFQPAGAVLATMRDGQGLNPLLRHPGMIIHPPMLYLGFVAYVIPFAFAIAALITGRTDARWIRLTRRWTLWAWLFLSLGLLLGSRWAYDVLGWGGYWAWDPVEIAAFMPWLSGTAFLHSVMIQEKRGILKHWNMFLIISTYLLVIFGTFLTRSGVLTSVHAFAQSDIGPAFFIFIGLMSVISLWLLLHRWDELRGDTTMTSMLSREALFLLNNLLFLSILFVCMWGVLFPLISELLTNEKLTFGPEWYEAATWPLFAALLLLMGIAPLAAWGHSTLKTLGKAIWKPALVALALGVGLPLVLGVRSWGALLGFYLLAMASSVTLYEFWRGAMARRHRAGENFLLALWRLAGRNRRRYGGYVIHLGIVLMGLGIIGIELFQVETQRSLPLGDEISLGRYTVRYDSLAIFDTNDGRNVARAELSIFQDGQFVGLLHPRRDYYFESQQPMTIPGVRSTVEGDLYIILADWMEISTQNATFKVYNNPLINWLWLGGLVLLLGTFVAAWPDKDPEAVEERATRRSSYAPQAGD